MSAGTVDLYRTNPAFIRPLCVWKIVISDNLRGKGTSFNPTRLGMIAARCLSCNGFAGDCDSYASVTGTDSGDL